MRFVLLAAVLAGFAACNTEPDWSTVETSLGDVDVSVPEYEQIVSTPIVYQDLPDYLDALKKYGWEFVSAEPAGPEFPASYLVISRRPR